MQTISPSRRLLPILATCCILTGCSAPSDWSWASLQAWVGKNLESAGQNLAQEREEILTESVQRTQEVPGTQITTQSGETYIIGKQAEDANE